MNPSLDTFLVSPLADFSGRLFCRDVGEGRSAFVGVLELPAKLPGEHLALFRVDGRPQVDIANTTAGLARQTHLNAYMLGEQDLNFVITSMQFAKTSRPDVFEMFVRQTHLEHASSGKQWCQVAGASAQRLDSMPKDGLYNVIPGVGVSLISDEPYRGKNIGQILREPVWGPGGQMGFATSMEPKVYDKWVEQNRLQNAERDPMYKAFLEKMKDQVAPSLVYTREEHQARSAAAARIVREVLAESAMATPSARP